MKLQSRKKYKGQDWVPGKETWEDGIWVQRNKEEHTTEDEPISLAQGQSEENYTPFPRSVVSDTLLS